MDATHLSTVPLFAGLPRGQQELIARLADEIDIPEGKELIHEGAFAYEFFAIESGTARVTRGDEHVADLGPGDFFGEVGATGRFTRNATVTATAPLTAIVMSAGDLRRIASEHPAVGEAIESAIAERAA